MDCYSHPADMIIGPKAANQQGSLGKFGCTPRYVRLHIHASRGGRGLPFVCPSLAARGPGPTATWGYTASVAAVSRQVKGRLTDACGESAGLLPSGGRYLPASPRLPISTRTRKGAVV